MMVSSFGHSINPGEFNDWLNGNGGYAGGCELYWSKADAFGVTRYQGQAVRFFAFTAPF